MKPAISFICFFLTFLSCEPVSQNKPELRIQNQSLDLGNISIDSISHVSFKLYNQGNADLIIDTISTSCDCTVPNFVKTKIAPSDSVNLVVAYSPLNIGPFEKSVVIKSNIDSFFTIVKFFGTIKSSTIISKNNSQ